jgi:RimJ/RimL family protein N-acetyltransferase
MTSKLLCAGCVVDQSNQPYSFWQGLNEDHQQQLLDFSQNDQEIVENTGDTTRFATPEKMNEWLSGPRIFYVLTPKEKPNEMSGLIWFSREELPIEVTDQATQKVLWTFAVRLYQRARGRHLSSPYMKKAFEQFWQHSPTEPVWLSTKATNTIAQKIYEKFGFSLLGEKDGRLFYILQPKSI